MEHTTGGQGYYTEQKIQQIATNKINITHIK